MAQYSNSGLETGLKKPVYGIWMIRQVTYLNHLNTGHQYCPVFGWLLYSDSYYLLFYVKKENISV